MDLTAKMDNGKTVAEWLADAAGHAATAQAHLGSITEQRTRVPDEVLLLAEGRLERGLSMVRRVRRRLAAA